MQRPSRCLPLLLLLCWPASADMISPPFVFSGGVSGSGSASVPNLNITENVFNAAGGWGVSFSLLGGTPSLGYDVTKTVTNNTGSSWNSFGFLVDGTSNAIPPVLPVLTLTNTPNISGVGVGSALGSGSGNQFGWSNISVAPGETITVTFHIQTCAGCSPAIGSISQFSTNGANGGGSGGNVPEPATIALLGSSLLVLVALQRKRCFAPLQP